MGTGESSGEKRAVEAAEAAIANPLLDDVSMRGARGLLISISGGNDLTLYEVDEAATRIREEVDPAANIILGATFDETLEGTMRVSVVATGLADEEAEVTDTDTIDLEEDTNPSVYGYSGIDHGQGLPIGQVPPVAQQSDQNDLQTRASNMIDAEMSAESSQEDMARLQQQEQQAVMPEMFTAPAQAEAPQQKDTADTATAPLMAPMAPRAERQAAMPTLDDFPPIARQQVEARQQQVNNIADKAHKKRKSLLERLASVGIGGGAKTRQEPTAQRSSDPASASGQPSVRDGQASGAANIHKLQPEIDPALEDEELEIPAFLRRQAN